MAKGYIVNSAFHSPGLNEWITRGTAHLVPDLPAAELKHALDQGHVKEIDLPAGAKTVQEADQMRENAQREAEEAAEAARVERSRSEQERVVKAAKADPDKAPPKTTGGTR